jgi:hypothetical protein
VHVAKAVDVYTERNSGDHNKHQCRDGVEQEAEFDNQFFRECQPSLVKEHSLQAMHSAVGQHFLESGITTKEISESCEIAEYQTQAHSGDAKTGSELMAHLASGNAQQQEVE